MVRGSADGGAIAPRPVIQIRQDPISVNTVWGTLRCQRQIVNANMITSQIFVLSTSLNFGATAVHATTPY